MNPQSEKKMANGDRLAETMTKREAFAIQMMASMRMANPEATSQNVAIDAMEDADALLAEMEKRNG
ncbi:hypothetical protein [Xanthomonas campestris]|uniref:hypothetical protein n=1 Tax=Xanthomonas campestris TaxID=339 RepID=UPI0005AED831|nr:hypothetical protein [Xanthomonas campestris]KIQ21564.1 hypothetical protein RT95_20675 [Xanthomonas campestris]